MSTEHLELADRLRKHVERLASSPRVPASKQHFAAKKYIKDQLLAYGFAAEDTTIMMQDLADCTNVIAEPTPADPQLPLVVVGAHYDSIPDCPGADDNASAVAALIELARWMHPRLKKTKNLGACLQLVAYDLEEYGMLGSYYHCQQIKASECKVRGMISLEMLGYADSRPGSQQLPPDLAHLYPDVGNFIGIVGNDSSLELLQTVTEGMKTIPDLPVESLSVPDNGNGVEVTRLSDHSNFWDHEYPALMITDTSFFRNPHYHQPSDTPDTLNYEFLAKVTKGICEAVWRLLQ